MHTGSYSIVQVQFGFEGSTSSTGCPTLQLVNPISTADIAKYFLFIISFNKQPVPFKLYAKNPRGPEVRRGFYNDRNLALRARYLRRFLRFFLPCTTVISSTKWPA